MTPAQKKRLFLSSGIFLLTFAAIGLLIYAIGKGIDHYYPLSEIAAYRVPVDQNGIRVGGIVEKGSVRRRGDSLALRFRIRDSKDHSLSITYNGILPDLFREGQGVVVRGRLDEDGLFHASEVLAKHDETYRPPPVRGDMEQSGDKDNSVAEKAP